MNKVINYNQINHKFSKRIIYKNHVFYQYNLCFNYKIKTKETKKEHL